MSGAAHRVAPKLVAVVYVLKGVVPEGLIWRQTNVHCISLLISEIFKGKHA